MNNNYYVKVSSLTKKYGCDTVVKSIDFDISSGEILGLLGPNGAGKTTTVLMLTTYLKSNSGHIFINGLSMENPKDHIAIQHCIGYVPQEISLYKEFNSIENLEFFGKLYGIPRKTLRKRIDELLVLVGLNEKSKQPVKYFSGGMQRRLNIAVALIHHPQFIILDEPTVGIDPQSRNRIFDVISNLKKAGTCILYITHYMEEAQLLCDKVAIMDNGKIIAIDTVAELLHLVKDQRVLNIQLDTWNDSLSQKLQKNYSVEKISYENGSLIIHTKDNADAVPNIIKFLYQSGNLIQGINIKEPNLQQVFLKLTGKNLRD